MFYLRMFSQTEVWTENWKKNLYQGKSESDNRLKMIHIFLPLNKFQDNIYHFKFLVILPFSFRHGWLTVWLVRKLRLWIRRNEKGIRLDFEYWKNFLIMVWFSWLLPFPGVWKRNLSQLSPEIQMSDLALSVGFLSHKKFKTWQLSMMHADEWTHVCLTFGEKCKVNPHYYYFHIFCSRHRKRDHLSIPSSVTLFSNPIRVNFLSSPLISIGMHNYVVGVWVGGIHSYAKCLQIGD